MIYLTLKLTLNYDIRKKTPLYKGVLGIWCRRRDLNPHAIARTAA